MVCRSAFLFFCFIGLVFGQNDTMFNETLDVVNIDCDTMSYMLPGVNVMLFQDDVLNGTNTTLLSNETIYDYNTTDSQEFTNETYEYDTEVFTFDNTTFENATFDNETLFNDDVMMKLEQMGFPFMISCLPDGQFVDIMVGSENNETQIVEIMAQVRIDGNASGFFLTPEMSADYQIGCLGHSVNQKHNDAKEMFSARWFNSEAVDLENGTNAQCVLSILDTNGNFWQMITLQATDANATATMMTESEEGETKEDIEFTATDFDMEEDNTKETDETAETPFSVPESESEKLSDTEEEVEFKPIDEDMGDLGQIAVDGETYDHHCINNNMIRVLVPFTGCSDFLTVVGGLPRSYQTCGLDKCFDANDCECKDCEMVTCEKLPAGSTQSYSIRIYDTEGKEVGVVSGERTRTISGGLTESISASGDPRSSLFPIGMK